MPAADPDAAVVAALPLDVVPPALDYASGNTPSIEPARPVFIAMTWLAVLSGLCVGSCFLVLFSEANPVAIAVHILIYAVTLWLAVRGGKLMAQYGAPSLRSQVLPVLDLVAGIGLLLVAVAPLLIDKNSGPPQLVGGLLGTAFLLLFASTPRHLLLYRGLSGLVAGVGRRRFAGWLVALGWIKFIYEGLWLFCCCVPLILLGALGTGLKQQFEEVAIYLAFGALFGAAGFTVVWIMMMITHGRLAVLTRPRRAYDYTGRAFEAGAAMPPAVPSIGWQDPLRRT